MTTNTDPRAIVGDLSPVNRTNCNHPLTGRADTARESVGDRRRIEQLEYELGHVICGFRSRIDATYCTDPPLPDKNRCKAHMSTYEALGTSRGGNKRYKVTAHKFYKCARCGIRPCEGRVTGGIADDCVYEIEQFEDLMQDAAKLATYGPTTQHLFAELVWSFVVISRLERLIAHEGMTVTHIDGCTVINGVPEFIRNESEHPGLKHLAKMQQSARGLATELELTPKSLTGKGAADNESDFKKHLAGLWKDSVKAYADKQTR